MPFVTPHSKPTDKPGWIRRVLAWLLGRKV